MAVACARALGFDETDAGRVALVGTEAASNLVKHAGGGTIVVQPGATPEARARPVEVLSIDRGPGMSDVDACLVDGFSTAGSPGTGLGAVRRLSTAFDCYSRAGSGTVLLASIAPLRAPRGGNGAVALGGVSVPHVGEQACGDDWDVRIEPAATTIVVGDGLGHGPLAAEAARAATATLASHGDRPLQDLVGLMHAALRPTRGAAVAVARIEPLERRVRFCGVGNISGRITDAGGVSRHLVSQHGTLGREVRRLQEFTYDWPAGSLLVLHSDGLASRWRVEDYPGLGARHPSLIAGVLFRDFWRGRDDGTAVVAQDRSGSA